MTLVVGGWCIDLRNLLHTTGDLDKLAKSGAPSLAHPLTLAVRNGAYIGVRRVDDGTYSATDGQGNVLSCSHATAGDAAFSRAQAMQERRDAKRKAFVDRLGVGLAEEDDVVFSHERTREQRDVEGKANAIELEDE